MGFFEAVSCQSTLSGFFLSFTTGSDDRLIWQVMGGEVADTSLLARCQGNFCGRRVTAFSMDLPDAGQHGAKHPHGKVPGRGGGGGAAASQEGPGHAEPRWPLRGLRAGVPQPPALLGEAAGPPAARFARGF